MAPKSMAIAVPIERIDETEKLNLAELPSLMPTHEPPSYSQREKLVLP
jgi:hypothetical protein